MALSTEALQHFADEVKEKVAAGQCKTVEWTSIKDNPPPQLKISPIAAIPHKSRSFRSILDLLFSLWLKNGGILHSVNNITVKLAPKGALDQLGHSLSRIIHAFAEALDNKDVRNFMAKWDIKDGFWRMCCVEGEEWNFSYVFPQAEDQPTIIVIPTSLQMGWVESPPYFCAALEMARDVAIDYINTKVGSIPLHKFTHYTQGDEADHIHALSGVALRYCLEVYVDDFMSLVIPTTREQLDHVASAITTGVHDVFPTSIINSDDPISEKKLKKGEGVYSTTKTLLGFDFDGTQKNTLA